MTGPTNRKRRTGWILKGVAVLAIIGVLGIAALLTVVWLEHQTIVNLPAPTGPFAVGREFYDWTDDAGIDTLAPVPGTKRELLVWLWYPSVSPSSAPVDSYLPVELRPKRNGGTSILTLLTRDDSKVRGHSIRSAQLSPQQRSYPVVIMRAGASSGVLNYSILIEDLVSHGYVVVGFDAPYRTGRIVFPDGRVIDRRPENNPELCAEKDVSQQADCMAKLVAAWTADTGYVLDRLERLKDSDPSGKFTGRLDMTSVGVFGHSLGGAIAAQFCHDDARCRAGIDIDGQPFGSVVKSGLRRPFMFLLADHHGTSDAVSRHIEANIQAIYDHMNPDNRLRIAIRGASHFTFSDDGAVLKSRVVRGALRMAGMLHIDARRQLAVTSYCVHTFFDAYLKGMSNTPLGISTSVYPEIQVLQ